MDAFSIMMVLICLTLFFTPSPFKEKKTKHGFTVWDKSDGLETMGTNGTIDVDERSVYIGFDGYGTAEEIDSDAWPIMIERWEHRLRIVVWNDINKCDPTIVEMNLAKLSNRGQQ